MVSINGRLKLSLRPHEAIGGFGRGSVAWKSVAKLIFGDRMHSLTTYGEAEVANVRQTSLLRALTYSVAGRDDGRQSVEGVLGLLEFCPASEKTGGIRPKLRCLMSCVERRRRKVLRSFRLRSSVVKGILSQRPKSKWTKCTGSKVLLNLRAHR
jgi:hypothetical protein